MEILNLNLTEEQAFEGAISSLSINNYGLFYVVLKKYAHFHFFRNLVKDPERTTFSAVQNSFAYDLIDTQVLDTDIPGIKCYEFYLRFSLNGTLGEHDEKGRHTTDQFFILKAIARARHFSNSYGMHHDDLWLFDEAQYRVILDERELRALRLKLGWTYLSNDQYDLQDAVTFFTGIWRKTQKDPNDKGRIKQLSDHTSLNFYHELESAYASIIYAALQAERLQAYVGSFKDHYYLYQGGKQYFIENNVFLNRHLEFLSYALAAIYTFWERLAFLVGLHLLPAKLKTISFFNLFNKQLNDLKQQFPSVAQSMELLYLSGRTTGRHADLMKYRHPLIHYQHQEDANRGNMNADLFRLMLENISDESELDKVYNELHLTMDFVRTEVSECKLGFRHTINLLRNIQEPI